MTDAELAAIRERERAATPDPWEAYGTATDYPWVASSGLLGAVFDQSNPRLLADVVFAAHARTDVPALLAALDEAHALISIMQRDTEAYLSGIAEGLRQAEELLQSAADEYSRKGLGKVNSSDWRSAVGVATGLLEGAERVRRLIRDTEETPR